MANLELVLVPTFRNVKLFGEDFSQVMVLHMLVRKYMFHDVRVPWWMSKGASNEDWCVEVMLCKGDFDGIGRMRRHDQYRTRSF